MKLDKISDKLFISPVMINESTVLKQKKIRHKNIHCSHQLICGTLIRKSFWINELENVATLASSRKRHGDISIPNRLLRPHGYADKISKSNRPHANKSKNTYTYLDGILIDTKRALEVQKVLQKNDEDIPAIFKDNCKFLWKQLDWLGYSIFSEGSTPLIRKRDAIEKLTLPIKFKLMKSFIGSKHHLTWYIPQLAQTVAARRPLLKNKGKNKTKD